MPGAWFSATIKKRLIFRRDFYARYLYFFSHFWFASVQDVLQADWQDVWHSPQPVFSLLFLRLPFTTVFICFMQ
jgi:hypothetical protein